MKYKKIKTIFWNACLENIITLFVAIVGNHGRSQVRSSDDLFCLGDNFNWNEKNKNMKYAFEINFIEILVKSKVEILVK